MSSTLRDDGSNLPRPVALAGCLWLIIAGLFGVGAVYLIALLPLVGLFYAIPSGLLAAFGFGLITRRGGVGLPLLSLILGTAATVAALLEATRQDPSTIAGNVVVALFGGAIALSSALTVWADRMDLRTLRAGMRRRTALAVVVLGVSVGTLTFAVNVGPLRGCVPIAPRALPSGAAPGQGAKDVSGGAKQVIWGSGTDRVEQIVGLTYWETFGSEDSPTFVQSLEVRGQPAIVYRMSPLSSDWDLGFSWAEDGCDRTVFLARGTTSEQAEEYAARY